MENWDEDHNLPRKADAAVSAEDDEEENQPGEERPGVLDELQEGEWITLDQAVCVRVPADEQTRVYVLMSMETDGSAIWQSGVNAEDNFETCWYLSKGQLLGCQSGIKDGGIQFAGILPQWKEERLGETLPLVGNGYIEEGERVFSYAEESDTARYYQERAVSILDPEVPGPLKSADTRLEEMAEQMDLEDAAAVALCLLSIYNKTRLNPKLRRTVSVQSAGYTNRKLEERLLWKIHGLGITPLLTIRFLKK